MLTGEQVDRLTDVLSTAFDPFTLNMMVTTRVDRRGLPQYASVYLSLPAQAFELVKHADAEGFVERLVEAARELRPKNAKLLALADELKMTPHARHPQRGELEGLVRVHAEFQDLFVFRSRLTEIEFQICRIEIQLEGADGIRGETTGTGFLVGSEMVMTNYHVIEPLLHEVDGWRAVREGAVVRFDYKKLGDGTINEGVTYALADPWLIDSSPIPALDYALIRLDRKAGDEAIAGWSAAASPPKRGWMTLAPSQHPFLPDTEMIIVQHPDGRPLEIAFDTQSIIELNAAKTRVRHRTNTERGSSGSPCFNAKLELVALHQSGDPVFKPPTFNAGVPIDTVVNTLKTRGVKVS